MSLVSGKRILWREAIRILMQSPLYFKISPSERKILVQKFCALYGDVLLTRNFEDRYNAHQQRPLSRISPI